MKNSVKYFTVLLLVTGALFADTSDTVKKSTKKVKKTVEQHKATKEHKSESKTVERKKSESTKGTPAKKTVYKRVESNKTEHVSTPKKTVTKPAKSANGTNPTLYERFFGTSNSKGAQAAAVAAPVLAAPVVGSLAATPGHQAFKSNSVAYALEQHPEIAAFNNAIKRYGVDKELAYGNYTIFAPLSASGLTSADAVKKYIVKGTYTNAQLAGYTGKSLTTLGAGHHQIHVTQQSGRLLVNGAQLTGHAVTTKNGIIHFITGSIQ